MHKSAFAAGLALALAAATPAAHAQQQQWAAAYVEWTVPAAPAQAATLSQDLAVFEPALASFFTLNWDFQGTEGGYIGLQSDETGQTNARFSLWNATVARGAACRPFDGEGVGMTCVLPLPIEPGRVYRVEVVRGATDAAGQWWTGYISDHGPNGTRARQSIGEIQVAAGSTQIDPATLHNFSEYWGNAVRACRDVPMSAAVFVAPTLNGVAGHTPIGTRPDGHPCARGTERSGAVASHAPLTTVNGMPAMVLVLGGTADASAAYAARVATTR